MSKKRILQEKRGILLCDGVFLDLDKSCSASHNLPGVLKWKPKSCCHQQLLTTGSRPVAWACLHVRITTTPSSSHTRDPLESAAEGSKADTNPTHAVSTRCLLKNIYSQAGEFVNHVTHNKACNASFATNITSNFSSKLISDSKNPLGQRLYQSFYFKGEKKHINNQGSKCRVGTAFSNTHNKTVLRQKDLLQKAPDRKYGALSPERSGQLHLPEALLSDGTTLSKWGLATYSNPAKFHWGTTHKVQILPSEHLDPPLENGVCNSSKLLSSILFKTLNLLILNKGFLTSTCMQNLVCVFMCSFPKQESMVVRGSKGCMSQKKLKHNSFKGCRTLPFGLFQESKVAQSGSEELPGIKHFLPGKILGKQSTFVGVAPSRFRGFFPLTTCWTSQLMQALQSRWQVSEVCA